MCFASPVAQTTPTNPAPYSLDQSYGAVTSDTVTADGKTHGGASIGAQYQSNQAAAGKAAAPATPAAPASTGANWKMM